MKTLALPFATSERSSVGLEWELALVDSDSGDLRQVAQTVLDAVRPPGGGEHPAIRQELLLNTVEVVSGVCRTVGEAGADLQRAIEEVRVVTDPLRVELMCAGTHPFARWTQWRSFSVRLSPPWTLAVWNECSTWTCTWLLTSSIVLLTCASIDLVSKFELSKPFSIEWLVLSTVFSVVSRIGRRRKK